MTMRRFYTVLALGPGLLTPSLALPLLAVLVGGACVTAVTAVAPGRSPYPPPEVLPPQQALRKAGVGGRYEMLLHQARAPKDAATYGEFRDLGPQPREVSGFPAHVRGHWVYVYPTWYVWRDLAAAPKLRRQWGPEQATGPPDTWPLTGDLPTAWAPLAREGRQEWLLLEYPEPIAPRTIVVYETFNPGALFRVTAFRLDGEEVEIWKGKDPTPAGSGRGISEIPVRVGFKTNRVKVFLDSTAVPGWNEIDSVGLRDGADKVHWATSAAASSTYAEQGR
jgi:hypothetical protein